MADEDEVDVLGDFSLENLFSKEDGRLTSCYDSGVLGSQGAELLHCDYNITPHWLLDTSTQPCWYGAADGFSSVAADTLPTSSNWGENDGWSEKEKSLLEKGLDLFGRSWVRLSQFIGTKSSQQVKSYVNSQHLDVGCVQEAFSVGDSGVFSFSELVDDMQIPASMEEVIAVVSTAQPTIPPVPRRHAGADGKKEIRSRGRRGRTLLKGVRKRAGMTSGRPGRKRRMEQDLSPEPVMLLTSSEEVIHIKKESSLDSDEDEDIEIEENVDSTAEIVPPPTAPPPPPPEPSPCPTVESRPPTSSEDEASSCTNAGHQAMLDSIYSLPMPSVEAQLDPSSITEQERVFHAEFFEGRSAKTPKRYLKIRNHILECWRHCRPSYVTKTSVRTGLKNCGDVNCIGRIHAYLEQIGAINFGCEQARYAPPCTGPAVLQGRDSKPSKARIEAMRPRKKRHPHDAWFTLDGDGGYTITHSADGEAIHTMVVQDSTSRLGTRTRTPKADPIKLIYCSKYDDSRPAPFTVSLHAEALLVMDVHAHSSHSEVAGLLGGMYQADQAKLTIVRALPCRTSSSGVHCDMCPVSQTEASERLQHEGLEVVGWYHSHPTFLPNPSLQDLATQASMQQWLTHAASAPIVGIILSPFCLTSRTLASQYRCLTVERSKTEGDDVAGTPFRLGVEVASQGLNVAALLSHMADIFALVQENRLAAVDFSASFPQQQEFTYLHKCVESTRLHLDSCRPALPEELRTAVVQGVIQACSTLALARGEGEV